MRHVYSFKQISYYFKTKLHMFINDLLECKYDQYLGTLDVMLIAVLKCQEVLKEGVDLSSS